MGEGAKHGHGHDGYRNRRTDRESRAQSQVGVGRAEDDSEQDPEPDCLDREFGRRFGGGHERIVGVAFFDRYVGFLAQSFFSHLDSLDPDQRAILR